MSDLRAQVSIWSESVTSDIADRYTKGKLQIANNVGPAVMIDSFTEVAISSLDVLYISNEAVGFGCC